MKPLNKTSDLLVLDLINEANVDAKLDLTKVTLLPPVDNTDEGAERNTKLTVKARKNSGYIKSQDVAYDRLVGQALFRNIAAYLRYIGPFPRLVPKYVSCSTRRLDCFHPNRLPVSF